MRQHFYTKAYIHVRTNGERDLLFQEVRWTGDVKHSVPFWHVFPSPSIRQEKQAVGPHTLTLAHTHPHPAFHEGKKRPPPHFSLTVLLACPLETSHILVTRLSFEPRPRKTSRADKIKPNKILHCLVAPLRTHRPDSRLPGGFVGQK